MAEVSRGQVNLNTVLGAVGSAGTVFSGLLGGLTGAPNNGGNQRGGNGGDSTDHYVTRYEAQKDARIAELETEVKLRDANTYTLSEVNKLRDYMEERFTQVNGALAQQAVHNATNDTIVGCIQNQVNQLMGMTKLVIPNSSVCPGWGNVTITPAAATTTT